MAKVDMTCPFSHKLCQECPHYRGRHYFLCFCEEYRGYVASTKGIAKTGIVQQRDLFANKELPRFEELDELAKTWEKDLEELLESDNSLFVIPGG